MTKFLSTTLLVGFILTGVQSLITSANAQDFGAQVVVGKEKSHEGGESDLEEHGKGR